MQLALDRFGRMVLPKTIRDDFGLKPGDKLEAIEQGDQIILRPVHAAPLVHSKEGVLVFAGRRTDTLTRAVSESREERLNALSRWDGRR